MRMCECTPCDRAAREAPVQSSCPRSLRLLGACHHHSRIVGTEDRRGEVLAYRTWIHALWCDSKQRASDCVPHPPDPVYARGDDVLTIMAEGCAQHPAVCAG